MPFPPKKRRRPYLERQLKRRRPYLGRVAKRPSEPSSPTSSTSSQTSSQALTTPVQPTLLTLPDDVFFRIIAILQNGAHHRGTVFQTARHAFPLALLSTASLSRYRASLHTIDARYATENDPYSPPLLREHQPPHIRNLVTIAKEHLTTLRLPRYEDSQIGAEAILPVIHYCTNLTTLSFVDHGRVDTHLTRSLFANSLQVVEVERPSRQVVKSLAMSSANLEQVRLSYIPFSAVQHVLDVLKFRGAGIKILSLGFDSRSIQVVEDSAVRAGESATVAELRRFLNLFYDYLVDWVPQLQQLEVISSDVRDLEYARAHPGDVLARGLGEVTNTVNELRQKSSMVPTQLCVISVCERSLKAIPGLLSLGEIRVRLPGYELRYHGRGRGDVKPRLWHCQMTPVLHTMDTDLWRVTGGIDTLNIGDEAMVRAFRNIRDDICGVIGNAKSLRRVISRLSLVDPHFAVRVLKYVTAVLQRAPWVRELEISHEVILYHDKAEFSKLIQSMSMLKVLHLNTPLECLRSCGKGRMTGFVRHLPKVLRLFAETCKGLEVVYCERIGEARVISAAKTREELTRKLGEIDVVIEGRLSHVDCASLKALVVTWAEQIKHE